jgi:hypothetical protein
MRAYVLKSPVLGLLNEFVVDAFILALINATGMCGLVVRKGRSRRAKLGRKKPRYP